MRDLLLDPERDVPAYAHAVNLCEVFYNFGRANPITAASAIEDLKGIGVEERADIDAAFWQDAATLIAAQRGQGLHLALVDAFGLTLARRENGDFYTADRHELTSVAASGLASVVFIR